MKKKARRQIIRTVQVLILFIVVLSIPLSNTLAKYVTTETTGDQTARVATWKVEFLANGILANENNEIDFVQGSTNVTDSEGNTLGSATDLIPGMSGLFVMEIRNSSEVVANWEKFSMKFGFKGEILTTEDAAYWNAKFKEFPLDITFYLSSDTVLNTLGNDDVEVEYDFESMSFGQVTESGETYYEAMVQFVVNSSTVNERVVNKALAIGSSTYLLMDWTWDDSETKDLQTIHDLLSHDTIKLGVYQVTYQDDVNNYDYYVTSFSDTSATVVGEMNYVQYQAYLNSTFAGGVIMLDFNADGTRDTLVTALTESNVDEILSDYRAIAEYPDYKVLSNNGKYNVLLYESITNARKAQCYCEFMAYQKYMMMGDYSSYTLNGIETQYSGYYEYLRYLLTLDGLCPSFTSVRATSVHYSDLTYAEKETISQYNVETCTNAQKADYYNLYNYEKHLTSEWFYDTFNWGKGDVNGANRVYDYTGNGYDLMSFMEKVYSYYNSMNSEISKFCVFGDNATSFKDAAGNVITDAVHSITDGSTTYYYYYYSYDELKTCKVLYNDVLTSAYNVLLASLREDITINSVTSKIYSINPATDSAYASLPVENTLALTTTADIACRLKVVKVQRAALRVIMYEKFYGIPSFFSSTVDRVNLSVNSDYLGGYFNYVLHLSSIGGIPRFTVWNSETNSYVEKWYTELSSTEINTILGYCNQRAVFDAVDTNSDYTTDAQRTAAKIDALEKLKMFYDLVNYKMYNSLRLVYESNIEFDNLELTPFIRFLPTVVQVD
ncbi:MAG: hypothetical protein PHX51_06465 [Clostridia bacterium]|nr:hypothetical protein [Clostridia bacterium]